MAIQSPQNIVELAVPVCRCLSRSKVCILFVGVLVSECKPLVLAPHVCWCSGAECSVPGRSDLPTVWKSS